MCWVKRYFVESSDILNEVLLCWVKWYIFWNDIIDWCVVLNDVWVEVMCWVKSYCFESSDVLSGTLLLSVRMCWVKCFFEWIVVSSEVIFWVNWFVVCSVVLCEVLCLVKWNFVEWCDDLNEVIFFFIFQIFFFLFSLIVVFTSFRSWSNVSLPTHCRCKILLLHLITLRLTKLGRNPLVKWSAQHKDL